MGSAKLIESAPAALEKLKANDNNWSKLKMDEMKAIAYVRFNGTQLKGDKATHVASMGKLMKAQPTILNLGTEVVAGVVREGEGGTESTVVQAYVEGGESEGEGEQ